MYQYFYQIRDKVNSDVAKMINFAFVHFHLAYGIEICGNTYTIHLNRLVIPDNKLLRKLQNVPRATAVAKLYANFNTLTLPELHTYQILKFVHNCIYTVSRKKRGSTFDIITLEKHARFFIIFALL